MPTLHKGTLKKVPLVSVISLHINRAVLLKQALNSVYAQEEIGRSFDIEVVVIVRCKT